MQQHYYSSSEIMNNLISFILVQKRDDAVASSSLSILDLINRRKSDTSDSELTGGAAHEPDDIHDVDDIDDIQDEIPTPIIVWLYDQSFNNDNDFGNFLKEENCWGFLMRVKIDRGIKTAYRCTHAKRRGRQCTAGIYTLHDSNPDNTTIQLFRKNLDHNHESLDNRAIRLAETDKNKIIELHESGHTPKAIMFVLSRDENSPQVTIAQVKNTIRAYKNEKYGKPTISLNDIIRFVEEHKEIPPENEEDKPFIVDIEHTNQLDEYDTIWFRYFVTTRRLLRIAIDAQNFHADATYKLTFHGYPLIIVGTTDMERRFHLFGMTLTTNETTGDFEFSFKCVKNTVEKLYNKRIQPKALICDGAKAIRNGFKNAFPDDASTMIMCWFHVVLNFSKIKLNDEKNRNDLKRDLDTLHLSFNEDIFDVGCNLFIQKWTNIEKECANHLKKVYFDDLKYWFNGAASHAPKTNNALESFNGSIKNHHSFYRKKSLAEFKVSLMQLVKDRSAEYTNDKRPFTSVITISQKLKDKGNAFYQSKKSYVSRCGVNSAKFYIFAGDNEAKMTENVVDNYLKHNYNSFDDFSQNVYKLYEVEFPKEVDQWTKSKCSCASFGKFYICKHIVGIAYRLGILEPEENASRFDLPLEPKKSRGRPKKASRALEID